MIPSLTVAAAQPLCTPGDPSANGRAHAAAIRAAGARLVVFPELSLTGYELAASPLPLTDEAFAPIVDACAVEGSEALVGAPVRSEDGDEHIAMLRVSAAGVEIVYRKVWLGAEESVRFRPGPAAVAIDVGGWRVGLGICRDTGIAEHAAQIEALGVDLYAAGLVHTPGELLVQDQRAAAMARRCGAYVVFASCAGPTGGGYDTTAGTSTIWSPAGQVLARAGADPGDLARATLVRDAG